METKMLWDKKSAVREGDFFVQKSFILRKCVIPVVCVKLGKWYIVKHKCVT